MKFVLRKFDDFLSGGGPALPDGVSFTGLDTFAPDIKPQTFLSAAGANLQALKRLSSGAEQARGIPAGILEFTDVCLLPPMGLILDPRSGTAWMGNLLGWSNGFSNRYLAAHAGLDAASQSFEADMPETGNIPEIDSLVLMTAGGYDIYGHWIVDLLPRFGMVRTAGLSGLPHYRKPKHDWAVRIAELVAPGCFSLPDGLDAGLCRVKRLLVPSAIRKHGVIVDRLALPAWAGFADILARQPVAASGESPKNIFVSRKNWDRKRGGVGQIANIEAVERRFNRAGFVSVSPEKLSFAEQRMMFAQAGAIAGEDGSGLHNIIFSKPGTRLGVLLSNRLNTLHAVIANALGQSVTYIGREQAIGPKKEQRSYNVPVAMMDQAIEELRHGA